MAKKKANKGIKSIEEMSDTEFITHLDYLASPYYKAYVNARAQSELGRDIWSGGVDMAAAERSRNRKKGDKRGYIKKRGVAVILMLVLMLFATFVCVSGLINSVKFFNNFAVVKVVGATDEVSEYIGVTDPIFGLFGGKDRENSVYFSNFLTEKVTEGKFLDKAAFYAVPVAAILLALCSVLGLLKAILALFSGIKGGYYHKFKFGFLSIVMFLSVSIMVLGTMMGAGVVLDGVADFFTLKSMSLQAGYGFFMLGAVSVVTFILSPICYKKEPRK